ncbi:MAG: lipopolysaccharide biosynthesis protein [Muribaculaceae bacterium]|nr:lipopolysaccharide biosynthesis protein [Muribaculaceae bacterium]
MTQTKDMKSLTADSVKWNIFDRAGTQILYGVTGIILARLLSVEDFALVGAILVFQAFASLMIDSGFMPALLQRKAPTCLDYSSVLWFNILAAVVIYIILYFAAPLIAAWYGGETRLIPLSRVMFLSFIINATALVPANRFNKQLNLRPVATANAAGLIAGAAVGIWGAFAGHGAWALVWQTLVLGTVKSIFLWTAARWKPMMRMSWKSLRSFFAVGGSMLFTSFLNTLFQNIYSFIIGNRIGMTPLGCYTQADKWSKMGIMSLVQVFQSSFMPALSDAQNEPERFTAIARRLNRFTAYVTFPAMIFLSVMATPLFHALFGPKWDAAVPLFQLLLVRGIFYLITTSYNNYIVARGQARLIVKVEIVRDITAFIALAATLPVMGLEIRGIPFAGLQIMLAGQIIAAIVAWGYTMVLSAETSGSTTAAFIGDALPSFFYAAIAAVPAYILLHIPVSPWIIFPLQAILSLALYVIINTLTRSAIQREVLAVVLSRFSKKTS